MLEGARFRGPGSAAGKIQRAVCPFSGASERGQQQGEAALAEQSGVLTQIARPYAVALFDLAKAENAVEAVEQGLDRLVALAGESPDFARFLRSPVINTEEKFVAMHAVLERAQPHTMVGSFVRVVARNGRLFALPAIIAAYKDLAAGHRGEVSANVTSAAPLGAAQARALAEALESKIGKSVALNQFVDPSLIGGLVVKVGSQMIDSSLKTKLQAMKIAMKEVG